MATGDVDGSFVPQGGMRPTEVVLDEPIGESLVEYLGIGKRIPFGNEFLLERAIKALADGVVLGRLCPTPPVLEL